MPATLAERPWLSIRNSACNTSRRHWLSWVGVRLVSHCRSCGVRAMVCTWDWPSSAWFSTASNLASRAAIKILLAWGSTTWTVVRCSICSRRSSNAVLSITRAAFGALAVKGAGMPAWRLGSTSQGQLESMATTTQSSNTAAMSRLRQRAGCCFGRSLRSS